MAVARPPDPFCVHPFASPPFGTDAGRTASHVAPSVTAPPTTSSRLNRSPKHSIAPSAVTTGINIWIEEPRATESSWNPYVIAIRRGHPPVRRRRME